MINYTPFLKLKIAEIMSLGTLPDDVGPNTIPFFELARRADYTSESLKDRIDHEVARIRRHASHLKAFYIDNSEIHDSIKISSRDSYAYLLRSCTDLNAIPVAGIDRSVEHNRYAVNWASSYSKILALRVERVEFASVDNCKEEIEDLLSSIPDDVMIHLIYDCKLVQPGDISELARKIIEFHEAISLRLNLGRVIVAGSSIDASTGRNVEVSSDATVERSEIKLFSLLKSKHRAFATATFGDYAIVSPDYSDFTLAPSVIYAVMTAKLTYSFGDSHYFVRGNSIKLNGHGQFATLAKKICSKPFYRGADYSFGDEFLHEKSQSLGKSCTAGSVLKPLFSAHITFMYRDAEL